MQEPQWHKETNSEIGHPWNMPHINSFRKKPIIDSSFYYNEMF